MRSVNRAETNLYQAEYLCDKIRRMGVKYGCLPVSIQALGGRIHLHHFLKKPLEQVTALSTIFQAGLDLGGFVEIAEEIDGESIEGILEILFSIRQNQENNQRFAGFLMLLTFSEEQSENNHALVVLPRELMGMRVQRKLEKQGKYMVVDSGGGKVVGKAHANDLAQYINEVLAFGGEVKIFQVFG